MQLDFNQTKKVALLESPKYYLALTALFRNEERFLKEWIEFYRLMGVEHFYLFNHLSADNYAKVIEPYVQEGTIDIFDLTYDPKTKNEWYYLQNRAYLSIIGNIKDEVEWLISVDIDEFLFPIREQSLSSVLRNYDEYASLSVNWRMFGSSDVRRIQDNELMIEKLIMRDNNPNLHVKTIVKPRYVENFNTHYAVMESGYGQVTENHQFINGHFSPTSSSNVLVINHYVYKDWDFFNATKLSRIHTVGTDLDDLEKEIRIQNLVKSNKKFSSVYDDDILRFAPALRLQMFGSSSVATNTKAIEFLSDKKLYPLPEGLKFVVEANDGDAPLSLNNGYGYEPYMIKKIMAFSASGEIYVGIGEGYGEFALQMSIKLGNSGKVYIFEPNNNLFQYLSTNIFLNNRSNIEFSQKLNDIVNLDSYFNSYSVDIIRINAAGQECEVIQGAENMIDCLPDLRLFIKWQGGSTQCLSGLLDKGFVFIDIKVFNEECSYLSYQVNYLLSIDNISDNKDIEILVVKEAVFEKYRQSYSDTPECIMLASQMMFNAALQGRNEDIKYCLSNGAKINHYDEQLSGPALYYAVSQNHSDTVLLLLEHGADIEFGYNKIVTPLFKAAEHGYYEIVEILLDHNADKDFTFYGRSSAQVALDNGHIEVAQLLLGGIIESSLDNI